MRVGEEDSCDLFPCSESPQVDLTVCRIGGLLKILFSVCSSFALIGVLRVQLLVLQPLDQALLPANFSCY